MKNPLTPAGIEPATFRFVTQHLNHCATAVPGLYQVVSSLKELQIKFGKLMHFGVKQDRFSHIPTSSTGLLNKTFQIFLDYYFPLKTKFT